MPIIKNLDPNELSKSPIDAYNIAICSPSAFTGETGARGDKDTAAGVFKLFNVTGTVLVKVFGICTVDLVGAATLEVGVAGNTAALIAQIADATGLDVGDIWADATPTLGATLFADVLGPYIVANGLDIEEKCGTADITAGNIFYICLWRPLSPDGKVEPAV